MYNQINNNKLSSVEENVNKDENNFCSATRNFVQPSYEGSTQPSYGGILLSGMF